jgi:hypothetical protein
MSVETNLSGLIAGYDPGGNHGHGLAVAEFYGGDCRSIVVETLQTAEAVIERLESLAHLRAIGVDTLAAWATGSSSWRPADLWLRSHYKQVSSSIVSPNGLYGSMGLNGMAVLLSARLRHPNIAITETHPKVLYWALTKKKYDYAGNSRSMDSELSSWLACDVETSNDHEWDAAVSVFAAVMGLSGRWTRDLFTEETPESGRLLFPAGQASYWWPER